MNQYSRRQIIRGGLASAGAVLGVHTLSGRAAATVVVEEFNAPDRSITTRDGSVHGVIIEPTVSLSWEGMTDGIDCSLTLDLTNPTTNETVSLETLDESITTTTGSIERSFTSHDLLTTELYDAAEFSVEEPGDHTETAVTYSIGIVVTDSDQIVLDGSAHTTSTLTVERLPEPEITAFSVEDDSNPAHTHCTVEWAVQDERTDLASVTSYLQFIGEPEPVDSASTTVAGESASGSHEFDIHDTSPDSYEIILTVANEEGIERTEVLAEDGEYASDDPVHETFLTLTATITETETHANQERPIAADISYVVDADDSVEFTTTMVVNNNESSVTESGTSGTVAIDVNPGGGPTEAADITVVVTEDESYATELTAADGTVSLLE